ncbi:MAG: hypothetical protein M0C28_18215 [Candidatus Moduliflexus flocculans]|nr:hypothetical protein [Candidatus Moduliflexus flocculans]
MPSEHHAAAPAHAAASAATGVSRAACMGGHATIRPHALPCGRGRPGRCRSPPHHGRDDLAARGPRGLGGAHRLGRRPVQHLERGVGGAHARGRSPRPLQRQHLLSAPGHAGLLRGEPRRRAARRCRSTGQAAAIPTSRTTRSCFSRSCSR